MSAKETGVRKDKIGEVRAALNTAANNPIETGSKQSVPVHVTPKGTVTFARRNG